MVVVGQMRVSQLQVEPGAGALRERLRYGRRRSFYGSVAAGGFTGRSCAWLAGAAHRGFRGRRFVLEATCNELIAVDSEWAWGATMAEISTMARSANFLKMMR